MSSAAIVHVGANTLDSATRWQLANGFHVEMSKETVDWFRSQDDPLGATPDHVWLERRFDCHCSTYLSTYVLRPKMDADEVVDESDAAEDPPETLPEAVSRLGDWVHQASGDLGQSIREAALISIAPASLPKDWNLEQLARFVVGASHAIDAEALRQAKDVEAEGGET